MTLEQANDQSRVSRDPRRERGKTNSTRSKKDPNDKLVLNSIPTTGSEVLHKPHLMISTLPSQHERRNTAGKGQRSILQMNFDGTRASQN